MQAALEIAPCPSCGSRVVTQPARPELCVFALGSLRVEAPAGPLSGEWLDHRPGQLLRFLACRRHTVASADAIAEAIWPHAGAGAPNTVRHFVHALREQLEPGRTKHGEASFVLCRRGGYGLDPERVWIDAEEFELLADVGLAALARGERHAARDQLERAVGLYADDLVADEPYAEWALSERERLRSLAGDALRALAQLHAADPAIALPHLARLAELEPFDSDVQRQLISALLRLGLRSRATRSYDSFRVRLLRHFGERPDFQLAQLP
jgi:DNA-binding SARP family transcriptional activator